MISENAPRRDVSSWAWPISHGLAGRVYLFALVAATYALGSGIALRLIAASGLQSVFFIPAGITVAFLLRLDKRVWWIVLAAAGMAEMIMDMTSGYAIGQSLGFAAANVAEPWVGATLVAAKCGAVDLARRRHVMWFTLGAVLVGPAIGAGIGAISDRVLGGDDFLTTFAQWWLGDSLGVVVVGGAILVWGSSLDRRSVLSYWGATVIFGSSALTALILSVTDLPLVFTVLIGVIIAGVLFGARAVAMTSLVIALTIALSLVVDSDGLVVGLSPDEAIVLVKLQLWMFSLAGLVVAAEAHERELAIGRATRAAIRAEHLDEERRRERALAVRVQRGLLPDRPLWRPDLHIAARYEAANDLLEVGGDWYDTIPLRDGRVGVVVGDIVGHGIDAMTSMGRLRTALAALAFQADGPAPLLEDTDEFVGGRDGTDFATVFYACVDLDQRSISYASAGHPPALLVSPSGSASWLEQGMSQPLFGRPREPRMEASTPFEPGSLLVLYSDGLVERRGSSLGEGMDRLREEVLRSIELGPAEMCDHLVTALREGSSDDTVVVVARLCPAPLPTLHQDFPARPEELRRVREVVRSWARAGSLPEEVGDDIVLTVGEAASNVVRHAYGASDGGRLGVDISIDGEVVSARVSDDGSWRGDDGATRQPGTGTKIMRSLTEELSIDRGPDGTRVSFVIPIQRRARR